MEDWGSTVNSPVGMYECSDRCFRKGSDCQSSITPSFHLDCSSSNDGCLKLWRCLSG